MLEQIMISVITVIVFIVILLLVQYMRNRKSIKERQEYFKELHKTLKVGNRVSFSNGFYGRIHKINNDDTVDIKIKEGIITVSRYAIMEILNWLNYKGEL